MTNDSNKNQIRKEIPIFFQLLNFLFGQDSHHYKLSYFDKLLIIGLAKHAGDRGIFPSEETLALELEASDRYVRERTKLLIGKQLLSIIKMGRKKYYFIHIPELGFQIGQNITGTVVPEYRNPSSKNTGTPVPHNNILINKINNKDDFESRKPEGQKHISEILKGLGTKSKFDKKRTL